MNHASTQVCVRLDPVSSPNFVACWWRAVSARWVARRKAERKAREFDFVAHLSADTLRDIGAPEYLISRAVAHRESLQQRLFALRQWRDG